MKPERRGGYFKVRALAWEPEHYKAAWSLEHPAPEWWAEIDVQWQIDHGTLMSVRKLGEFLGWTKRSTEGLLARCRGDLESWDGTVRGQKRTPKVSGAETGAGQSDKEEAPKPEADGDTSGTLRGQSGDTSGTPRVRAIPYGSDSDSDPDPDPDTTHTEHAAGVCVVSPDGGGGPAAARSLTDRQMDDRALDRSSNDRSTRAAAEELVRDWHRMLKRPIPMALTGVDLAIQLLAAHGDGAAEVVRRASQVLQERGMLAKTISFGGLKSVLAAPDETVSSAPPPPPPIDPKEVFQGEELAHAEALWRQAMERRVGPQNMAIWFAQLRVGFLASNFVRLEVESAYYLRWIEDNLGRDVELAWAEVLGAEPRVSIVVAPPASSKVEPSTSVDRVGEKRVDAPQSSTGPSLRLVRPEEQLPEDIDERGGEVIELLAPASTEAAALLQRALALAVDARKGEAGWKLAQRLGWRAELVARLRELAAGEAPVGALAELRGQLEELEAGRDLPARREENTTNTTGAREQQVPVGRR